MTKNKFKMPTVIHSPCEKLVFIICSLLPFLVLDIHWIYWIDALYPVGWIGLTPIFFYHTVFEAV